MSRARAIEPVTSAGQPFVVGEVGHGSIILYCGPDDQIRPAIVTRLGADSVNAVVFGADHADSEAGLKVGLVRKGDHWVAA